MSDLVRVMSECTHRAGLLPMFEQQLAEACIPFCMESSPAYEGGIRRLGAYIKHLRMMLDRYGDCERIVISDAWDMLFYGTAEETVSKIPSDHILIGAERNCWPDPCLAPYYHGTTPWKFLNSGLIASSPETLSTWLDEIEKHPCYHPGFIDQQWFCHRYLDKTLPMELDSETKLGYCMFLDAGEMQPREGKPYNILCKTWPNFVHFNGKADSALFFWKCASSLLLQAIPA